ncbi:MAG TPA: bifunctional DNA primase/helicase, partial [Candidatus Merdenecus merdavium]|nr:bifunctional DNA primase/helicase [Candidatus Merdenecus merdavium]
MLSKDEILNRTNRGLDVFKHYISFPFKIGRNFLNPLYEDNKASCNIYLDRTNNIYRLKDFGNDDYSGDCFSFVAQLKGLNCNHSQSFVEILKHISNDLNLSSSSISTPKVNKKHTSDTPQVTIIEKEVKPYKFGQKSFSDAELAYWAKFGITQKTLSSYRVVSLQRYESESNDGESFTLTNTNTEPIFGYLGKRYVKLYRPFSKMRFLYGGDFGDKYCFGLEQLPTKGDTLFITGGEKDVMTLASQ